MINDFLSVCLHYVETMNLSLINNNQNMMWKNWIFFFVNNNHHFRFPFKRAIIILFLIQIHYMTNFSIFLPSPIIIFSPFSLFFLEPFSGINIFIRKLISVLDRRFFISHLWFVRACQMTIFDHLKFFLYFFHKQFHFSSGLHFTFDRHYLLWMLWKF